MMSLRRIFGLMLLFLFFEGVVAVTTLLTLSSAYVVKACLIMTGLAVLTWVVFVLLSRSLSRPRAAKESAAKAFVPAAQRNPGDDVFTQDLLRLVEEADRRLVSLSLSKTDKVAPTIRSLPLYLVVGPEGSGKTSAIVNSGLEPKLLAGEAQKDGQVVPTALANIWYAEGVIFFEIGGRIFLQESDRWEKALQALASQRPLTKWQKLLGHRKASSNLRGVILACDIGMFGQTRNTRLADTTSRTVQERLQALQRLMREDFPVYVLLTRCDSVRYFEEFFSQINEPESRRVLGVTLPAKVGENELANSYADRESDRLMKLFNRLYQSLADKRLLLLSREELPDRRAKAYEFPREFKKLRGEIVQFLIESFRPSTLLPPCRLRGFYLTGKKYIARDEVAIPDGTTLDYSVVRRNDATVFFHAQGRSSTLDYSVAAQSVVMSRPMKQIFLTDLFRNIVLKDPAARVKAVVAPRVEDGRYMHAALAACGTFFLVLSFLWIFSWQKNHRLLTEVEAAVRSTSTDAEAQPVSTRFEQLESIRPMMATLHYYQHDGVPLEYRWGMYSGSDVMDDLDSLYYTRFRRAVLDPMVGEMNQYFLALRAEHPVNDDVYKQLKVYRTLTSGKCKPDEALVASAIVRSQNFTSASQVDGEGFVEKQALFYASELKYGDPYKGNIPENGEAVETAQVYLRNLSGPDKILQALLNQVRDKPAERLSGYAVNYSQVLTGPDQMDGPYTSTGWATVSESIREHKAVQSGEPCVVGESGSKSSLVGSSEMDGQVSKLYSDSYAQAWKLYLQGHHVVPFNGTLDAAQKLRTLADNNRSPLLALVFMASVNTNVAPMQSLGEEVEGKITRAANTAGSAIDSVARRFGVEHKIASPANSGQPSSAPTVISDFDAIHTMVDPRSTNKWLNEKNQPYMKALADLSDALQTLPSQVHNDVPLETQELQTAKTTLLAADSALHSLAANFPNTASGVDIDLENLLREPIDQARRTVSNVAILKTPAAGGAAPAPVAGPTVDPGALLKIRASIRQVNLSAAGLCSTLAGLQHKFPFDGTSTTDASLDEINGLLQPGTGTYSQFANSPDVSRTFTHAGRIWSAKSDFPANYSQAFVGTLNNLGEVEDEMYGQGSTAPHLDLTLTVDGTGKLPFELDVDGHTIKFTPGKPVAPVRLVWPPVTNAATRLVLKASKKGNDLPAQYAGPWGLFHLLQAADDQSGNVYTFRSVRFANSLMPLTNDKGGPATVQIRVDSAASNLFGRGYFAKLRCNDPVALQGLGN